jgi:predicted ATPase/signal transduction histidine kinase
MTQQPGELTPSPGIIYESITTRISRQHGPGLVFKESFGPDAALRQSHEKALLLRLAGLKGIAQLQPDSCLPGALALHDFGGGPLDELLLAGRLVPAAVAALALALARIVAEVHRAGVIHRDINPSNILIQASGEPVLIDFDLAVIADGLTGVSDHMTGTLAYLAPEQTGRTGRVVDQRADLYALGATLYELATGRPPFDSADTLQLIHDQLLREPVPPAQLDAGVSPALSAIILRLLAKAPEDRYQSAEGLAHDLARLTREPGGASQSAFTLGERDFAARLAPSSLIGRSRQQAMLRAAFARAMLSRRRTVLVTGPAGVGKSALINDLRPIVAAANGWLVQGKVDQYHKDASTSGELVQVLGALGGQLLALAQGEMTRQRARILERLGRNAALIARLVPEFEVLLGVQPGPLEADPRQAQLQLQQATVELIGAIVSPGRTLVIVLDDLQWAGSQLLRIFERLMDQPSLRGLLLVGACRNEEAAQNPELARMLMAWQKQPCRPTRIALRGLNASGMSALTGQMLRMESPAAAALAASVSALTAGNPFDSVELINTLRKEGVLTLADTGWQWEEARVRRFVGRGVVADLLAARIARLVPPARELLECMSCLSHTVELRLLAAAAGLDELTARNALMPSVEDGLVEPARTGRRGLMRFRHDRVQQAVLDSLDSARRTGLQLAMARRLADKPAFAIDAAQQYLGCHESLSDPAEKRLAAQLLQSMAQKLAATASYLMAERYLAAASALLGSLDEAQDTAEISSINIARHTALYSLGRLSEADELYEVICAQTSDVLDLVEPACIQMRMLDMRGRMPDTMKLGADMLSRLGMQIPAGFDAPDIGLRLDALADWVREDSQLEHASRAQISDRRLRSIARLMDRMVRSSFNLLDLKAFTWLLLEAQRLWAEHGACPELICCLGRLNGLLIALRDDYRTGYDIARHVCSVGEALGYEPQTSEARCLFAGYACHWFEPLEDAAVHTRRAFTGVLDGSDVSFACYVYRGVLMPLIDLSPTVDDCAAQAQAGIDLGEATGNLHAAALHSCERQLMKALGGKTVAPQSFDDAQFDETAFMTRYGRMPYVLHTHHTQHALLCLVCGDARALKVHADGAMALLHKLPGYYMSFHVHLFVALACAWELQAGAAERADAEIGNAALDHAALHTRLEAARSWLAARAANQPHNFQHLVTLVEAEQAWAMGELWKATTAFSAAVTQAQSRQRPWHRALVTERAGLFHLTHGLDHPGRALVREAHELYRVWGAVAKLTLMRQRHDFLSPLADSALMATGPGKAPGPGASIRATHRGSRGGSLTSSVAVGASEALDLMGVLRASQALSSETGLERLTARVTDVLASLSGATAVKVLQWMDGQWCLLAPAAGEPPVALADAADRGLLPLSAISYAERTRQPLLVDDVMRDDRFARDPYFAGVTLCSMLVAPIDSQGSTRAMLLLENRLVRSAFHARRLDAVKLIAGQLAVSMANAQLYDALERRVQARTRELEETQAQLIATARKAGRAEIANNVLHNVGNVLNSVNVSAGTLRRTIDKSRLAGLGLAVEVMKKREMELPAFMRGDAPGQSLLAYLGAAVSELQVERQSALEDIDRLASNIDHISYVVANQQTHAGTISMVEMARAQDLLEEALRLSAGPLQRYGIRVERRFAHVPAAALDIQRLTLILVNLIGNAAQAMAELAVEDRVLTLECGLALAGSTAYSEQRLPADLPDEFQAEGQHERPHEGQQRQILSISVRDRGEGIAPENLPRLFAHGFTTRASGHGFGLHSSALAAMEMGAKISAHSDGVGCGAVFTLHIPLS